MDRQSHTDRSVCISLRELSKRARKWKPVRVSVNGWYGMSMTLHIYSVMEKHMHFCVWHPATVISHEWIQLLTGGLTAPAGRSLSHTESSQWTSTALHLFVQGNTHMFSIRPHVSYTLLPDMPILLLKPDAAFKCYRREHLVMVNWQNNANNYFPEKK